MRKLLLTVILISSAVAMFAQNNKVVSAYNYYRYEEYDKAKEAIDAATVHPKTANLEKTWFYRAQIYFELSRNKKFASLSEGAADEAYKSLKKALLLNFADPENQTLDLENNVDDMVKFYQLVQDQKTRYVSTEHMATMLMMTPQMGNFFAVQGDKLLREQKDYKNALKNFEKSLFLSDLVGKIDTVVYYYAAFAADKAENYKDAGTYYKKLIKYKYGKDSKEKASMYIFYAQTFMAQQDTVKYIETLDKGRKAYPEESILIIEMINYYITIGKPEKAEEMILLAIEKDPENKVLHFNIGTIFEATGRAEEAVTSYKKAIAIDSNYFDANYNLGALFINMAAEVHEKQQALGMSKEDQKKYDQLQKEKTALYENALPFLEKAYHIKPDDMITVKTLWQIQRNLGNLDKAEEYDKVYKELKGKE